MARFQPISRRTWLTSVAAGSAVGALSWRLEADDSKPEETSRFRARLAEFASWVKQHGGKLSAHAVDLQSGKVLGDASGELALNPASNMKIVTAAVALDRLGPNFRFQTGLYGALTGRRISELVLRGNGDPSLSEAQLWRLAHALRGLGVEAIEKLWVDQSAFDAQFVPPAFGQQPDEWATFRAPVSAIAVDRNTVTLNVLANAPGEPARVWFQPQGAVQVQGQIATHARGRGQNIQLELKPTESGLVAQVGGHIATGLPRQRFKKRVDDPRLLPGAIFASLLADLGVRVGSTALGGQSETRRLSYVTSEPLAQLLPELGKHSDNFFAEMIFKALATQSEQGPASWTQAASVVTEWLKETSALEPGTKIANGSGLFDANHLSARSLVRVLSSAYTSPKTQAEFLTQLSIGGVDGTLRSRFRAFRDSRRIRAKTGTLHAVNALSGYLLRDTLGPPIAFSILVNDIPGQHAAIRDQIDATVAALA